MLNLCPRCILNPNLKLFLFLFLLQVRQLQEDAVRLQSAYAGDKADDIQKREGEVRPGEALTTSGLGSSSL